jgi:hypothetical protein
VKVKAAAAQLRGCGITSGSARSGAELVRCALSGLLSSKEETEMLRPPLHSTSYHEAIKGSVFFLKKNENFIIKGLSIMYVSIISS